MATFSYYAKGFFDQSIMPSEEQNRAFVSGQLEGGADCLPELFQVRARFIQRKTVIMLSKMTRP